MARCVLVTVGTMLAACGGYGSDDPTGKVNTPSDREAPTSDENKPASTTASCSNGHTDESLELGTTQTARCRDNSFVFTAPNDVAGGLVRLDFENRKGVDFTYRVIALGDKSRLTEYSDNQTDHSLTGWVGVKANAKYRIEIDSKDEAYDVKTTYAKLDDPQEPNDSREAAKEIALDTDIKGIAFGGLDRMSEMQDEDYDDWFRVELAEGDAKLELKNPDPDTTHQISLFDATGKLIDSESSPTTGADVSLSRSVAAGTYFVRIRLNGTTFRVGLQGTDEPPRAGMTTPYVFRVEQP